MILPDRRILTGMVLGALCAMGVAAIGPGAIVAAIADETRVGIDPDSLVKFDGQNYNVQYEDWVDTKPSSHTRIKKVEFGRVSYVDITNTKTGTYSSDGLLSPNVQYPGITVTKAPSQVASALSILGIGGNWVGLPLAAGNSFIHIRSRNHTTIIGGGVNCVILKYSTRC